MTDLATWTARSTHLDPATAAEVWTDPAAPEVVLRRLPAPVLDHLLGDGVNRGTLSAVLRNPALPNSALTALATQAKGHARATISRHALRAPADVPRLIAAAPAITAAELAKTIDGLRSGWEQRNNPDAARATLSTLLRTFTTSSSTRCRALAAQAFPLTVGPRHRYAEGEVSATKLATDPEIAVLVALARNYHVRNLPESGEGLAVRRALLSSPTPRVRAAARRAGLHVLTGHVVAALSAADGHLMPGDVAASGAELADPLDDPAPSVRVTAVVNGIFQQDGARWARVLADPSLQVRKAAAIHGYFTPSFVWDGLARDPDPGVRAAVASSWWAPVELQRRLLSDVNQKVAAAADAANPLSRPVRVRVTVHPTAEIPLPLSCTHDPGICLLDLTAVTLTCDQQQQLAAAARIDTSRRAAARSRVIGRLGTSRQARWVVDRWERWCAVFAIPAPAGSMIWWEKKVSAPFVGAQEDDERATGALALFDAVLGLAAAPGALAELAEEDGTFAPDALYATGHDQNPADLALLTGPWEQLLPTLVTEDTVYGPRTPAARRLFDTAARLPPVRLNAMLTTRIGIEDHSWKTARGEAVEAVAGPQEHVYAAHFLFWDAVTVAELAAGQRPTDPLLADALWGAAAVTLHSDRLSPATIEILARPGAAAGLSPLVHG